jgi:hypothetical protein
VLVSVLRHARGIVDGGAVSTLFPMRGEVMAKNIREVFGQAKPGDQPEGLEILGSVCMVAVAVNI